jgi:hypothetical protein
MRRRVGAVIKAQFAVITLVDDPAMVVCRQFRHVPLILVDAVEKRVE